MTESTLPSELSKPARYILHPTDFSQRSDSALAHALRLALTNHADLDLLHCGKDTDEEWDEFPSIRGFLENWGMISAGADRSAVGDLDIGIEKVIAVERSVVDAIENYCQRRPIDMIVMASGGRKGLASWLLPSKAERVAEKASKNFIPTMFVPSKSRGCVAIDTGEVTMDNILVPVDHHPSSESAVERGLRAISMYGGEQTKLTLLHIGSESNFPKVEIPEGNWQIQRIVRQGNPAAEILAAAEQCHANVIIMVTEGSDGFLDVLRGTTTEQVLREAPCPVLAIPSKA